MTTSPLRTEHSKLRLASPRLKDVTPAPSVREPSEGRTEGGRFAPGNRASVGHGWKATIRKGLGAGVDDAVVTELVRDAVKVYLGVLRSLPSDGPLVRSEAAAHARRAVLAGYFANEAARVGLLTADGRALVELSTKQDQAASRHATAARAQAHLEAEATAKARAHVRSIDPLAAYRLPTDGGKS